MPFRQIYNIVNDGMAFGQNQRRIMLINYLKPSVRILAHKSVLHLHQRPWLANGITYFLLFIDVLSFRIKGESIFRKV
jgi:hypothetical protein